MHGPGPTIADIARAAEVSTATVSHALGGTGRVGESTRRRVREVAAALGYSARRGPRTRTLGLAVTTYGGSAWNFVEVAYFSRLLTAAVAAAHARGYALTVLPADRGAEPLWHTLAVDGMLLLDSPAGDPVLRALRARGLPVVFDGRPPDLRPGDVWVDNDHEATTREVLDHLAASGARRIALHSAYGREHYTEAVTSAYTRWCAARGAAALVVPFDPEDTAGHAFDAAFAGPDRRDRPDAVYCVYDPGGRQVLAAAARHRLRIPRELRLVCASEDPAYATGDPAVSTVTLRPEVIGERAVAALTALLETHGEPPSRLIVPAALTVRTSSR
ncbi:LacI family DNA-binding transcriptional regulator [Streptomyces sp. RerS4]|uniref:LacI family DNA-binding transcriptional regulator n=1 Tax=Streptomyces sp. RerS4 TaxID=2942449 RepID=UPI00201C38F2|nr:LacI family DNA-binding transcriptional regulator [Streptomyces sp. RerS4]UQX03577.1 LacI family transcriptional regulator [Streptomyces sp. RerS4]